MFSLLEALVYISKLRPNCTTLARSRSHLRALRNLVQGAVVTALITGLAAITNALSFGGTNCSCDRNRSSHDGAYGSCLLCAQAAGDFQAGQQALGKHSAISWESVGGPQPTVRH